MNNSDCGPGTAIVSVADLGIYCWQARRFIKRSRCERVLTCTYPCKGKCKAVDAEIEYLSQYIIDIQKSSLNRMQQIGQTIMELHQLRVRDR